MHPFQVHSLPNSSTMQLSHQKCLASLHPTIIYNLGSVEESHMIDFLKTLQHNILPIGCVFLSRAFVLLSCVLWICFGVHPTLTLTLSPDLRKPGL